MIAEETAPPRHDVPAIDDEWALRRDLLLLAADRHGRRIRKLSRLRARGSAG